MTPFPPRIRLPRGHNFRWREDTARYLLDRGEHFRSPFLRVPNGPTFVWPVGTENFRYSSSAQVAIHKYIGEADVAVSVIYRSEPHIEIAGTFPGNTGAANMRALLAVLEARTPARGKSLWLPYIFPRILYVAAESWNFDHDGSDRTRSIGYQVSFIKHGQARRRKSVAPPDKPVDPGMSDPPRFFRVKDGYRTLRKISKRVYKTETRWNRLYQKNKKVLDKHFKKRKIPRHKYPTTRLPLGMRLRY